MKNSTEHGIIKYNEIKIIMALPRQLVVKAEMKIETINNKD